MKESSFLNRETSADEVDDKKAERAVDSTSPPPAKEGIPIRR